MVEPASGECYIPTLGAHSPARRVDGDQPSSRILKTALGCLVILGPYSFQDGMKNIPSLHPSRNSIEMVYQFGVWYPIE